jgi:hypothetical protein
MGWKEKLKVAEYVISAEIDKYLEGHGFYKSTLSPRFFNEESYSSQIIEPDATCLRLDTDDHKDSDYTMRIFITPKEVYMEVQNSWRSFDRSHHTKIHEVLDISRIDKILDDISSK